MCTLAQFTVNTAEQDRTMKFDIIAGINYPHRLAYAKSAEEVIGWLKTNDYVRLSESRIGLGTTEITVIPRATYERRADLARNSAALHFEKPGRA